MPWPSTADRRPTSSLSSGAVLIWAGRSDAGSRTVVESILFSGTSEPDPAVDSAGAGDTASVTTALVVGDNAAGVDDASVSRSSSVVDTAVGADVAVVEANTAAADLMSAMDSASRTEAAGPTPLERTITIAAESRVFPVPAENRELSAAAESRAVVVEADNRVVVVPPENRTLEA